MNYLAHFLLAAHSDAALLGAFLGDFVKGPLPAMDSETAVEIGVHRHIDSVTDAHPSVRAALLRFAPERRRFAPIALDVFHDHVLARDWAHYASRYASRYTSNDASRYTSHDASRHVSRDSSRDGQESLPQFAQRVYAVLQAHADQLPEHARLVAQRMVAYDWLGSYVEFAVVPQALERIGQRLKRNGHLLAACAQDLQLHYAELAEAVPGLMADLHAQAAQQRLALAAQG